MENPPHTRHAEKGRIVMTVIAVHELDIKNLAQLGILKDPVYNGFDNCVTFQIDESRQRLGQNDTLIYDFERAMQAPALEMMLRGFKVDKWERERAIASTNKKRDATEKILQAIASGTIGSYNPKLSGSPKQLQHLFYDVMKLNPIAKTINGETKYPMDRETLERLEKINKFASITVNTILFFRDLKKTLQVLETEIDDDWRWRCSYNIGGTKTGRWSSSKSPLGTGNNFQNINEELRKVFIPDTGYKLYGIDKAQSEARDVGWFCGTILGDWSYLDACESGDLHTYVTRMLYQSGITAKKPDGSVITSHWTGDLKRDRLVADQEFYRLFSYRDASKRLAHATNYFGKPNEISRQTRIPLELVGEFQRRYFSAFPCIPRMHQWIIQYLQRHRHLVNSFGRHRDFFDRPEDQETIKSAIAYMFQSATGDCLNLGLWRLWNRMRHKVQILSQLHDAVYFQAPEPESDEAERKLLRECLDCVQITQHDRRSGRSMTIPGDVVGGYNWAHRKYIKETNTIKNPKGLATIKL